jgi:3-oxosteroid 1-dehydrogenase
MKAEMQDFDQTVDVVVIGSGAGGMTTAWTAAQLGLEAVILEKTELFGGNSALSGGGAWMPNAPEFIRRGERDDPEEVLAYLRAIAPDVDPVRQRKFLEEAPKVHEALEKLPIFQNGFFWNRGYSDYHPELGGNPLGRGLWPVPLDQRILGEDSARLRGTAILPGAPRGMWVTSSDVKDLVRMRWGSRLRRYKFMLRMAGRIIYSRVTGAEIVGSGRALMTRLRLAVQGAGVPILLNTPMKSLVTDKSGAVIGVIAERDGKPFRLRARRGVVIAAGGFEFNEEMRRQYQPVLGGIGNSLGSPGNTGDGIRAGEAVGAATDLMNEAWWFPVMSTPSGLRSIFHERQAPGQFIVNAEGRRFVNEACSYVAFGRAQVAGHGTGVSHIPAFLITDHHGWTHNMIANHLPGKPMPQDWIDSGAVTIADTLEALAEKLNIPPQALAATAERFNGFAREGRDLDFHRGESAYDNYYGDHRLRNPNLAEVNRPPYYAFRVVPGDLGTKGGLLTDENARVLNAEGIPISGLYAVGNSSAAVMGRSYAGPGATIGPAMTFGWVAAHSIAGANSTSADIADSVNRHAALSGSVAK